MVPRYGNETPLNEGKETEPRTQGRSVLRMHMSLLIGHEEDGRLREGTLLPTVTVLGKSLTSLALVPSIGFALYYCHEAYVRKALHLLAYNTQ